MSADLTTLTLSPIAYYRHALWALDDPEEIRRVALSGFRNWEAVVDFCVARGLTPPQPEATVAQLRADPSIADRISSLSGQPAQQERPV